MKTKQNSKKKVEKFVDESASEDTDGSIDSESDDVKNKNNDMKIKQDSKNQVDKIVNKYISEDLSDSFDSESDNEENKNNNDMQVKQEIKERIKEDVNESDSEDSEEESESDDSSEEQNDDDFDHKWQELRNEAPDTNEITHRLAVCNMDWDRIRATDIFVCFDSFKPAGGCINSVKIYPSEFGLKRMEEEKLKGPPELTKETLPIDKEEVEDKKGSKFHREKLRQYQISRLKYYYAVVDCDSAETANALYEQLNGMEYESSAVRFDLRFIPDDMTFDHEPTSVIDKAPDPTEYKPRLFVTTALQQVKVDLTWDETDPKRREFFQKIFTDPDSVQNDIHDFIASASSESEEDIDSEEKESGKKLSTQERLAKYRELLQSLEEKEKEEENKYDIEVTWEPALKEKTEEKVKEKIKKESLNPFEELLLKKKEGKKIKKKEHKIKKEPEDSDDSEEESSENTSEKKSANDKKLAELALITDSKQQPECEENIKKKKKKAVSHELEGFVGDMDDPRFSAMYTSSLFNMIPSDQHPKKESNFGFKQQRNKKFKSKSHDASKSSKRARYN